MNTMLAPAKAQLDDDALYEIIEGERIEEAPMSKLTGEVASAIHGELFIWKRANPGIGTINSEVLYDMPVSDRSRRPDVAFISYQKYPYARVIEPDGHFPVPPDLAIEVVSPTDYGREIEEKVEEYFENGVRQVWVVYPESRKVRVFDGPYKERLVHGTDLLKSEILPGFAVVVDTLFPKLEAES